MALFIIMSRAINTHFSTKFNKTDERRIINMLNFTRDA